jgi:uncharacterized protein (TIGR02145 family)
MKKIFLTLAAVVIFCNVGKAQNDTMYIMKSGVIVGRYNVNTEIDSVIYYQPVIQPGDTFSDSRDGNIYLTVTIGNQQWMAENLKYLPSVVGPSNGSYTTPKYYVYGYSGTNVADAKATTNYSTYGVLYNWPAAMAGSASSTANPSGVQGVCPTGWHIPSDAEWTALTDYLTNSGYGYEGSGSDIAKSLAATSGWTAYGSEGNVGNDQASNNSSGFSALPGGIRNGGGLFEFIGDNISWWSATESGASDVWYLTVAYFESSVGRYYLPKEVGFSVRCVRD